MPTFVKSTVLTAALLVGVAASAYAQSTSIAALPPGDKAPSAARVPLGPSVSEEAFPTGPRNVWKDMAKVQPPAASPFIGPAPYSDTTDSE